MEEKQFTWIPFYKELAKALLKYKDNRKPLVDWIYAELSKVTGGGGKSLVEYIHNRDKSNVTDIDPFSVIAIFNRNSLTIENRIAYCEKFKEMFGLKAEVPDNFDGIPTVFTMRAFFFHWDKKDRTEYLWELLDKIVDNQDISDVFDFLIEDEMPKYTLTMLLYWVRPEQYLALDSRNRSYFQNFGFTADNTIFNYNNYMEIVDKAKVLMIDGTIDCKTFPELSYQAWKSSQTSRIWMFNGNEETFSTNYLKMGSAAKGALKFEEYKSKVALGNAYRSLVGNKDVRVPLMHWKFMHDVEVGDIVIIFGTKKEKGKQWHLLYGWGRFVSDYKLDYSDDNPIQREVEWNLPIPHEPIKETKTKNALVFHDVSGTEAANIIKLLKINQEEKVNMETSDNKYIELLKTNHNLILTGAPGTGKTHLAKEIAKEMLGVESVEALSKDKRFGFVQFHPSYDYTDFVEGLRPTKDYNGNVGFERKDGVFKEFCKQAILSETTDAVFVIDEINRGEISKIFGELFFSIDPGYRGKKGIVKTQYQNMIDEGDAFKDGFYVPENVYIIGTMNDIDRSVESMDFAMRRRFAWEEVTAEESMIMLNGMENEAEIKERMISLNNEIAKMDVLGTQYQIGAAYFKKIADNKENFQELWDYHLKGLLFEYLRGSRDVKSQMDKLEKAYNRVNPDESVD